MISIDQSTRLESWGNRVFARSGSPDIDQCLAQPFYACLHTMRTVGDQLLICGINPGTGREDSLQRLGLGWGTIYQQHILDPSRRGVHLYGPYQPLGRAPWGMADRGHTKLWNYASIITAAILGIDEAEAKARYLSWIPAGNLIPYGSFREGAGPGWERMLEDGLGLPKILKPKLWVMIGQTTAQAALLQLGSSAQEAPIPLGPSGRHEIFWGSVHWGGRKGWYISTRHWVGGPSYHDLKMGMRTALDRIAADGLDLPGYRDDLRGAIQTAQKAP